MFSAAVSKYKNIDGFFFSGSPETVSSPHLAGLTFDRVLFELTGK